METINMQCKSTSQIDSGSYSLYAETCLSDRAYMYSYIGEVLIKI